MWMWVAEGLLGRSGLSDVVVVVALLWGDGWWPTVGVVTFEPADEIVPGIGGWGLETDGRGCVVALGGLAGGVSFEVLEGGCCLLAPEPIVAVAFPLCAACLIMAITGEFLP